MKLLEELATRAWLLQYGSSARHLFPLERRLLDELIASLSVGIGAVIRKQVQSYNLFQRDGNHQRLDFYSKTLWRTTFPESLRLSVSRSEFRLMTAAFRVRGGGPERHVVFWCVNGRLSLMSFNDSYRSIREETDIEFLKKTVAVPPLDRQPPERP